MNEDITYDERMKIRVRVRAGWEKIKKTVDADCLHSDIYHKLYYSEEFGSSEVQINLQKAEKARQNNDIEALQNILDDLHEKPQLRFLNWYKDEILKVIGCDISEVSHILSQIKTEEEADIVLAAIQSSDYLTSLEKGYSAAKKLKQKQQRKNFFNDTYEHGVRRNRRILEKMLHDIGVGTNKAKKISQILLSI